MEAFPAGSGAPALHPLVERCVAGEQAAWRDLHRRYHRTAIAVLRRLGVGPEQLEDACQDVFLSVFRYLPRFRHEADFQTWLYRICVSHARVARRRARTVSFFKSLLPDMGGEPAGQPLDEGQASRQLAKALDRLPEAERVVFVLFEFEGLSGKEIANVVRCPAATVFRRLHDARKHFGAALDGGQG
jgi:RNA polymerase sigma-70 factor (ECF subfamily)